MKNCTIDKIDSSCPPNSSCAQIKTPAPEGICNCLARFTFNENFTSDLDYCLAAAVTSAPPIKNETVAAVAPTPQEVTKQLIPPEPGHLVSGIVMPLLVVFAFIGAVFMVRKYDLLERAQEYIRERREGRSRNNYVNDFDEFDDPLLI